MNYFVTHDKRPIACCYIIDNVLTDVFVIPEYRNMGIGTLLLNNVLHKYTPLLYVEESNINAIKLYEKVGFKKVKQDKHIITMSCNTILGGGKLKLGMHLELP